MISEKVGILDWEKIGKGLLVGLKAEGERWNPLFAMSGWWHKEPDNVQLAKK